jgi:hypothetical protein
MNNRTPDSHYAWTKKWGAGQLRRLTNRNAVLLALNYLADDGGVIVGASAKGVAEAARRSLELTRGVLRDFEADGTLTRLDWRDGISTQVFVLMDFPGARVFVDENRAVYNGGRVPRGRAPEGDKWAGKKGA